MNLNYLAAALLIPSLLFTAFSYTLNNPDGHGAEAAGAVLANLLISGILTVFVALVAQSFWKRGFATAGLPALAIFTILSGMLVNYGDHRSFSPIVASAERSVERLSSTDAEPRELIENPAALGAAVAAHTRPVDPVVAICNHGFIVKGHCEQAR